EQVYPGVDVVYYGHQRDLEYDFVVAPGGDPAAIRLAFDGADRIEIDGAGDLILQLGGHTLRQHRPFIYQDVDGVRREVRGGYLLMGREARRVGFAVGPYDASKPLVIDPTLAYSTYLGGSAWDSADAITVDAAGNAYVTGHTSSTDFPATSGAFSAHANGNGVGDVFVAKLNPAGNALVYATYLGGSGIDEGLGIAVDASGSAYVTGRAGANFPTTAGAYQPAYGTPPAGSGGDGDAFVAKLDPTGANLVYSTYLAGTDLDEAYGIAVDAAGNAYVTGRTYSSGFPTTSGAFQTILGGLSDVFVTKLESSGSSLGYSTFLGGSGFDWGFGIALDAAGNAYVAGRTSSDFPLANPLQPNPGGLGDGFIAKLNAAGSTLIYSTFLGGSRYDEVDAIAVDGSGQAYVTGWTMSTDFPATGGAFRTSNASAATAGTDAFVTKVDAAGSSLVYSTYLGGSGTDSGSAIAVDASGRAHVTGRSESTDFPMVDPLQPVSDTYGDGFLAKFNPAGSALVQSTGLGGDGSESGSGIAVDASSCNVYLAGETHSLVFPTTSGAFQTTAHGGGDAFVTKIANAPPAPATTSPSGKVKTTNPTYQWEADSAATEYSLRVEARSGLVLKETYVASRICEGAICRVTPDVKLTDDLYSWYVRATNDCGEGLWSVKRDFVVTIAQAPAAPTLISPTGTIPAQSPTYTWNAVSAAAEYLVWVDGPLGNVVNTWFNAGNICSGSTCSVTPVLTLSANTTYTWKVRARNAGGTGLWSATLSFTVAGTKQ
ncbi:MAG TPA: SBBP repeat-containing protein, partial [Vicinamibacteria bacterium]